jgi:plastocyanin
MNTRSLTLAALAAALGACKSSTANLPPAGAVITIADYQFSPDTVTVKTGTIVEWDNQGPSTHTVTSDSTLWASQTLGPPGGGGGYGGSSAGGSFRFTFNGTGTIKYHCMIHSQMHGVVIVTP